MSHFVQTFVWRNGWVSGLLWDIDGFVMKFLAMPLRSERRYLPRLGVQNGNLPQNGCGGKTHGVSHFDQRFVRRNGWVPAETVAAMPGMEKSFVMPLHCGGRCWGPYLGSLGPKLAVLRNANRNFYN